MKRLRLVRLQVHAEVVADDGESLQAIQTQPFVVDAAALDGFADKLRADLATAELALNDPDAVSGTAPESVV